MGWKDDQRTVKRIKEIFGVDYDDQNPIYQLLCDLYEKGYEDGWRGANNYDPLWDAD